MWTEGTVHLKISKDPTQNPALRQSESTECATDHPIVFLIPYIIIGDRVAQWLRCCATNQKVAGSIPDDVIEIFH